MAGDKTMLQTCCILLLPSLITERCKDNFDRWSRLFSVNKYLLYLRDAGFTMHYTHKANTSSKKSSNKFIQTQQQSELYMYCISWKRQTKLIWWDTWVNSYCICLKSNTKEGTFCRTTKQLSFNTLTLQHLSKQKEKHSFYPVIFFVNLFKLCDDVLSVDKFEYTCAIYDSSFQAWSLLL